MNLIEQILYESSLFSKKDQEAMERWRIEQHKGEQKKKEILNTITSIKKKFNTPSYEAGDCAIVSLELLKRENLPGYALYSVLVNEDEHVLLYNSKTKEIIDPTVGQFIHKPTINDYFPKRDWNSIGYKYFTKVKPPEVQAIEKETKSTLRQRKVKY